jgi:hypothetical protein
MGVNLIGLCDPSWSLGLLVVPYVLLDSPSVAWNVDQLLVRT